MCEKPSLRTPQDCLPQKNEEHSRQHAPTFEKFVECKIFTPPCADAEKVPKLQKNKHREKHREILQLQNGKNARLMVQPFHNVQHYEQDSRERQRCEQYVSDYVFRNYVNSVFARFLIKLSVRRRQCKQCHDGYEIGYKTSTAIERL